MNDAASKHLGYTQEELKRLSPRDLISERDKDNGRDIAQELHVNKAAVLERELITKAGRTIPVEIHATLFYYVGRPTVISIARDISRRKSSE